MKKNPLLIAKTNSNRHKINRAKKMLTFSLLGLFAFALIFFCSVLNVHDVQGFLKATGASSASLAFVPFIAGVRGTKAINGSDETEAEFAARAGKAEDEAAFMKRIINTLNSSIEAEKTARENAIAELKKQIPAAGADAEKVKLIEKEIEKHGLALEAMKENVSKNSPQSQLKTFIKDNHSKIVEMYKKGSGFVELEVKTVGNITTGSATSPDGVPTIAGVQMAPASRVNLRGTIVEGLVTRFTTGQSAYPYTESIPKDGDYTFLAEGGTKQQIDFKLETRYAQPKKTAAWIGLSEESVNDIAGLQGIAENYLRDKHNLKRQNGFLFGDGTGNNPKGATAYGRAFVAGTMASSVANPNFMDVVNAAITDIFTTHNYTDEMPYMANLVMVNPIDFFINLVSAKDGFGHPLYPSASLFNQVTIGGVTIIPFEDIPTGKIFVADMSKYNITDWVGYTVRIGWINDDFIKNQFVMLGESRFHAFVKKLDEQAFIYDDIDTIKAAILKA